VHASESFPMNSVYEEVRAPIPTRCIEKRCDGRLLFHQGAIYDCQRSAQQVGKRHPGSANKHARVIDPDEVLDEAIVATQQDASLQAPTMSANSLHDLFTVPQADYETVGDGIHFVQARDAEESGATHRLHT